MNRFESGFPLAKPPRSQRRISFRQAIDGPRNAGLHLRVRDLDFERKLIYVRAAKGGKDRSTLFPESLHPAMKSQVQKVERLHQQDLADGYGQAYIPGALARKYPNAAKSLGWQYLFPSKMRSPDPRPRKTRRHHVLESGLQKPGITKPAGCHTFRHCFATHLLENGVNIRVVQELMGHANVKRPPRSTPM